MYGIQQQTKKIMVMEFKNTFLTESAESGVFRSINCDVRLSVCNLSTRRTERDGDFSSKRFFLKLLN